MSRRKGQSIFEFVTLAVAVAAALAALLGTGLIRKAVSGKMKDSSDRIGGSFFFTPETNPSIRTVRVINEATSEEVVGGNTEYLSSGSWSANRRLE